MISIFLFNVVFTAFWTSTSAFKLKDDKNLKLPLLCRLTSKVMDLVTVSLQNCLKSLPAQSKYQPNAVSLLSWVNNSGECYEIIIKAWLEWWCLRTNWGGEQLETPNTELETAYGMIHGEHGLLTQPTLSLLSKGCCALVIPPSFSTYLFSDANCSKCKLSQCEHPEAPSVGVICIHCKCDCFIVHGWRKCSTHSQDPGQDPGFCSGGSALSICHDGLSMGGFRRSHVYCRSEALGQAECNNAKGQSEEENFLAQGRY